MNRSNAFGHLSGPLPFAIGQGKPFQTGPYLGGFIYVLLVAVAAAGTVTVAPGFVARTVLCWPAPGGGAYPSRVQLAGGANLSPKSCVVTFESAQPAGTVLFIL